MKSGELVEVIAQHELVDLLAVVDADNGNLRCAVGLDVEVGGVESELFVGAPVFLDGQSRGEGGVVAFFERVDGGRRALQHRA
jgi:hypothetical protein